MRTAAGWPVGYGLKEFEAIDSTNEEARRLAAAGVRGPVWIVADRQTAGRGRRGRTWQSPTGNLATTLFLRPEKPTGECAQLSFVASLAAADAVNGFAAGADVRVKWPNDVLADGRKIAGILLESAGAANTYLEWLAIGIGINLAYHPKDTEFPATSLAALGCIVPPARDALARLAAGWVKWHDIWSTRGFPEIRDAWLARAAGLGTRIKAKLMSEEMVGVFEGIDEAGALILRGSHGHTRAIAAGEVFFEAGRGEALPS